MWTGSHSECCLISHNFYYAKLAHLGMMCFFLQKNRPIIYAEIYAYDMTVVLQEKTRGDSLGQVYLLIAVIE